MFLFKFCSSPCKLQLWNQEKRAAPNIVQNSHCWTGIIIRKKREILGQKSLSVYMWLSLKVYIYIYILYIIYYIYYIALSGEREFSYFTGDEVNQWGKQVCMNFKAKENPANCICDTALFKWFSGSFILTNYDCY